MANPAFHLVPLISVVLVAGAQTSLPPQPGNTMHAEQTEQGHVAIAGRFVAYRIRKLPLSSFPEIPEPIRKALEQLHCAVPQTYEARRPENVIHGHFYDKKSSDWAVLCSSSGSTTLEFISERDAASHVELASHRDLERLSLTSAGGDMAGYNWGIEIAPASRVGEVAGNAPKPFDHDGIEDSTIERSSTIHYYQGGWITLDPQQE